uniref:Metalloprotease TIKI n=1 Tax=Knipowitschia caucasica TaxID=637954 RepID=A0AAV2IZ53_KNICA
MQFVAINCWVTTIFFWDLKEPGSGSAQAQQDSEILPSGAGLEGIGAKHEHQQKQSEFGLAHVVPARVFTMRGSVAALLHSCLMLLVRAEQWLKDSGNCELNKKQSELNSFLWTIKRDPPSYFYGTIHVPYTRVWDYIPENSKQAFQESSIVYFELDLTDPYTISALTSCQLLPQGENLQDVLPRDIYRRLKRHLEYVKLMMPSWMTPDQRGKGLYADYLFNAIAGNWERKRPVWVMLMVNSLTEADIKTRGVPVLDLYLAQEAERMRKRTGAVEKVEEQCHPLNGLNFSQVS